MAVSAPFYVVLLHYPIVNRRGETVTTAVTNMDIHDIARTARTYGARGYFLVTPILEQQDLVGRILSHWSTQASREGHPDRYEAVSRVKLVSTFEEVKQAINEDFKDLQSETTSELEVILTDAQRRPGLTQVSYGQLRSELEDPTREHPMALVLGTGWGVSEIFYPNVDRVLEPIFGSEGEGGYNHLSVRAAAATIMDRLFGCR